MSNRTETKLIVIRGAGEIASGVIWHLVNNHYPVIALEQKQPVCVRRFVSFANACYETNWEVDGVQSVLVDNIDEALIVLQQKIVPLLVDPDGDSLFQLKPAILIDGRMKKRQKAEKQLFDVIVIGLGPGFIAGDNCNVVIETNRGKNLGRVIYQGSPEKYTGIPSAVNSYSTERVIRAPLGGMFAAKLRIGDMVKKNDVIGSVDSQDLFAKINGVLRGLIHTDLYVHSGQKLGDIDPRGDRELCYQMSDKAQAVGAGVLEAVRSLS